MLTTEQKIRQYRNKRNALEIRIQRECLINGEILKVRTGSETGVICCCDNRRHDEEELLLDIQQMRIINRLLHSEEHGKMLITSYIKMLYDLQQCIADRTCEAIVSQRINY